MGFLLQHSIHLHSYTYFNVYAAIAVAVPSTCNISFFGLNRQTIHIHYSGSVRFGSVCEVYVCVFFWFFMISAKKCIDSLCLRFVPLKIRSIHRHKKNEPIEYKIPKRIELKSANIDAKVEILLIFFFVFLLLVKLKENTSSNFDAEQQRMGAQSWRNEKKFEKQLTKAIKAKMAKRKKRKEETC